MSVRTVVRDQVKSRIPSRAYMALHEAGRRYDLWRLRPLPTRVFGPRWRRSREGALIDITYVCDLGCFNCNRSCPQNPTSDRMSTGQIRQFLEESKERQIRWKYIILAGGEPTCHPDFLEIAELVARYRDEFSPDTRIWIVSNGYSERARTLLSQVPKSVRVHNTAKTTAAQPSFYTFQVAPIDVAQYRRADFFNACYETQECGMGVTPYGYYPCAVAGAIDRTFGFDLGRKAIPEQSDDMRDEVRRFCALCGRFKLGACEPLEGPVASQTWTEAYERARQSPAVLSRLAERTDPRS